MKSCLSLALLGFLCLTLGLQAQDLQTLKLYGRWSKPPLNYFLGTTDSFNGLAISDQWIVAGADSASELATNQGAVQVFNAATGTWVRKLLPPGPATANEGFGDAIAISGNLAVISSNRHFSPGRVHVYDLKTGKKLRELVQPNGATNVYGADVEISGETVLVSARDTDSSRGAVHLFSLKTGAHLSTLKPADLEPSDLFGVDISVDGNLAAIGAPGGNFNNGCVYLYDIPTATLIKKITYAPAVSSDNFGFRIALSGGKLCFALNAEASFGGIGKVVSVDLITGLARTFTASDAENGVFLGSLLSAHSGLLVANYANKFYVFDLHGSSSTATEITAVNGPTFFARRGLVIHNGTVICSLESDDTLADGAGAVCVARTFTRPLPMSKVAGRGDSAPGAAECLFGTLGDAFINPEGEVGFTSKLTGPGSGGGRDTGFWSSQRADLIGWPSGMVNLVAKSRDEILGSKIVSFGQPLFNRPFLSLYLANRAGSNNQIIMKDNGLVTERLIQNALGTAELSYTGLVQSHLFDRAAYGVKLKKGVNGVDATNDSALIFAQPSVTNQLNPVLEGIREGSEIASTGVYYGQIPGRAALYSQSLLYPATVPGNAAFNQALLFKYYGAPEVVLALKGAEAPNTSNHYSTFIGESTDDLGSNLWRATLKAPVSENEALWTKNGSDPFQIIFRKGDSIPNLAGVKIARIINYWISNKQTIALVKLSGSNVTAANDQALLLSQNTSNVFGVKLVLMREGDPAPGCHPATIGTISRVEVETFYGQYLVLSTLSGAPASANQCLFRGATFKALNSTTEQYLRRPVAILRKGGLHTGRPSKVKSISLPKSNLSVGGAGSCGLSTAMQATTGSVTPNNIVLTLEFENKTRQIMKGIP